MDHHRPTTYGLLALAALAWCLLAPARGEAQNAHCTKPDGEGILFIGPSFYTTTGGFDANGRRTSYGEQARFTRSQLGAYVEYGATDDLTLIGNFAAVRLDSRNASGTVSNTGLANPELSFAAAVERWPVIGRAFCAAGIAVKLPFRSGGDPLIGFAQTDVEWRLRSLDGFSIAGRSGYWVTDVGLRYRAGAPADEFRFNALGALRYARNWTAMISAITSTGLRNGQPIEISSNFTLNPDYASYFVQGALLYRHARARHYQFGVSQELAGRNAGSGTTLSLVIWQYY